MILVIRYSLNHHFDVRMLEIFFPLTTLASKWPSPADSANHQFHPCCAARSGYMPLDLTVEAVMGFSLVA
jgi:hypothetical protein